MSVDIISKGSGKVLGIKKYIKMMNILKEETMAFGDGENDLEMLEFVEYGVALGNGVDELKKIANYVTDDIDDDGVYNAIQHYINLY